MLQDTWKDTVWVSCFHGVEIYMWKVCKIFWVPTTTVSKEQQRNKNLGLDLVMTADICRKPNDIQSPDERRASSWSKGKQGLKRNSCPGAEFLQLGSRLQQHTARGDVMFWGWWWHHNSSYEQKSGHIVIVECSLYVIGTCRGCNREQNTERLTNILGMEIVKPLHKIVLSHFLCQGMDGCDGCPCDTCIKPLHKLFFSLISFVPGWMDPHVIPVSNLGINCFFLWFPLVPEWIGCPWNISNLLPKLFFVDFILCLNGWVQILECPLKQKLDQVNWVQVTHDISNMSTIYINWMQETMVTSANWFLIAPTAPRRADW